MIFLEIIVIFAVTAKNTNLFCDAISRHFFHFVLWVSNKPAYESQKLLIQS